MAWEATESALVISTSLVEGGSVIGTSIAAVVAVVATSMVGAGGEVLVEGCPEGEGEIPTT